MHVCTGSGGNVTDPEGNTCSWTGCGFNTVSPNQHFGGCSGSADNQAGTLCCTSPMFQWYVAPTGSDTNPGSPSLPFKTITHGLSLAVSGDSLLVAPGTYTGADGEIFPLNIPASVNLIGDEAGRGASPLTKISGEVDAGPGATIAGFTVTTSSGIAIKPIADGAFIRNNTITGNSVGIYVSNSTNHVITLNVVSGNSGQGILYVSSTAGGKAENNVITNNGYGVVYQSAGGDFGGGPSSSVGGNVISCNTNADFWTNQLGPIYAANNLLGPRPAHL
jgi:parallel beta-helix repeat protein